MAAAKKKSKVASSSAEVAHCHVPTAEDKKREAEWRAESDARTLLQAADIRKDKDRLSKAKAWARRQADAMKAVN